MTVWWMRWKRQLALTRKGARCSWLCQYLITGHFIYDWLTNLHKKKQIASQKNILEINKAIIYNIYYNTPQYTSQSDYQLIINKVKWNEPDWHLLVVQVCEHYLYLYFTFVSGVCRFCARCFCRNWFVL